MSLQLAAQHLASHGRGNDSMLIHVSPNELKSLNDLAQIKGGSLSVNPNTGLPEAGFLEDMLPVAAAVALDYFAPGAGQAVGGALGLSSAAGTAAIVGGTTALLTGSIGKGLSAGLGAYGGSSLFGSLGDVGAAAAMPATGGGTAEQAIMQQEAAMAAQQARSPFTNAWEGLGESIKDPSKLANAAGGWGALSKQAAMAAAPLLMYGMPAPKKQEQPAAVDDKDMGQRYAYTRKALPTPAPDPYGREQVYYSGDTYTPISSTKAKSMYGYADGGITDGLPEYAQPAVIRMAEGGSAPDVQYKYDPATQDFILVSSTNPSADVGTGEQSNTLGSKSFDGPRGGSTVNPAIASQQAAFAALTPGEQAAQTAMAIPSLVNLALPMPVKALMAVMGIAPPGSTSSGGVSSTSGSPMGGIASKGNVGQVANAVTTANNAAAAGGTGAGPGGGGGNAGIGAGATASGVGTGIGAGASSGAGLATGGLSNAHYNLGGYSDGGRLLRGPGDGVSDSIPAVIGKKQPARLADGEFVVPARIVSELGNGSTEAGARKLYAMMDRIQSARGKTVGKGKVAKNSRAEKYLPA